MKFNRLFLFLLFFVFLGACQTSHQLEEINTRKIDVSGSIEITKYTIESTTADKCEIKGRLTDEDEEPMAFQRLKLDSTDFEIDCDIDGNFKFENIRSGNYVLRAQHISSEDCTIAISLTDGDHVKIEAIIAQSAEIFDLKPIIYIYPEEKTEVEIELNYGGEITTTYPKLPTNGWNVTAFPDGTLIDENKKEYYALYWEGKPRNPLKIDDGFVVSNEETIPFLEEKLAQLGLNAKESNEFIIFWLPILEKNSFNLIHFAGDDYSEQAQLNISPTPETMIRVMMVFQGLDEEIEFPIQDLTSLIKMRSGFTAVEWGGQQVYKSPKLAAR